MSTVRSLAGDAATVGQPITYAFASGRRDFLAGDAGRRFWPVQVADARTAAAAAHDDADPYSDCFDPWGDSPATDEGHL